MNSASATLIVPAYHSDLGAHTKVYLRFDGDTTPTWSTYAPGVTPAYDIDGDATTFSDQEIENIHLIWEGVAEKYSPFNVDVTTVDPGNVNNLETNRIVIGGSGGWAPAGSGGIAIQSSFAINGFPNIAFVFPGHLANGNPRFVAEASAHEAGHGFGLNHQSVYDSGGNLIKQYNPGDADRAPIMGVSYRATRGQWWKGPNPNGASLIQDDLSILSKTNVSLANNFGYRADDHGNSISDVSHPPDPLDIAPDFSLSGKGIIEQATDSDYFSFSTPGGTARIYADVAPFAPMLDLSLSLYDASGNLLTSSATSSLGEQVAYALTAGTYYVSVSSAGNYGDIGQYFISGSAVPEPGSLGVIAIVCSALVRRRRSSAGSRPRTP